MLPAPPKSLGRLGDVLISALHCVQGASNPLGLSSKRSVCVILVDGLGTQNLSQAGGHARFLNSQKSAAASSWFPATTSSSITSFATGKHPAEIGFLGYQVFNRASGVPMNLLSGWDSFEAGMEYQSQKTISELATESGIDLNVVGPRSYEHSGFTGATMRSANYHGQDNIADRFKTALELLADSERKVIFLYVPELDQIAHSQGSTSTHWLNQLEELDSLLSAFIAKVPKQSGVVLTADHGVIDIKRENHIFLDELLDLEELDFVGGDTRAPFIYFKAGVDVSAKKAQLEIQLQGISYVASPADLVSAGYWVTTEGWNHIQPDLVLIARKEVAFYHRSFAKRKSLEMVGHHGSITAQEMSIPLITFGF